MPVNRRTFLLSGFGAVAASRSTAAAATASDDWVGKRKDDLPTPALLLDLDAFEFNLKTMADHCRQSGCGFRPHAKTHKCVEVGKRQVASGALGVSTATVPEAEAMVAAGIRGVLLTSPIVEPGKIARMVALIKQGGEVLLAVGHPRQAALLAEAAEVGQVAIDVLVDVDVGDRRTGILPGQPALELAQLLAKSHRLRVRGVQAYAGHASHAMGFEHREKVSREAMAKAVQTRELLAN